MSTATASHPPPTHPHTHRRIPVPATQPLLTYTHARLHKPKYACTNSFLCDQRTPQEKMLDGTLPEQAQQELLMHTIAF